MSLYLIENIALWLIIGKTLIFDQTHSYFVEYKKELIWDCQELNSCFIQNEHESHVLNENSKDHSPLFDYQTFFRQTSWWSITQISNKTDFDRCDFRQLLKAKRVGFAVVGF